MKLLFVAVLFMLHFVGLARSKDASDTPDKPTSTGSGDVSGAAPTHAPGVITSGRKNCAALFKDCEDEKSILINTATNVNDTLHDRLRDLKAMTIEYGEACKQKPPTSGAVEDWNQPAQPVAARGLLPRWWGDCKKVEKAAAEFCYTTNHELRVNLEQQRNKIPSIEKQIRMLSSDVYHCRNPAPLLRRSGGWDPPVIQEPTDLRNECQLITESLKREDQALSFQLSEMQRLMGARPVTGPTLDATNSEDSISSGPSLEPSLEKRGKSESQRADDMRRRVTQCYEELVQALDSARSHSDQIISLQDDVLGDSFATVMSSKKINRTRSKSSSIYSQGTTDIVEEHQEIQAHALERRRNHCKSENARIDKMKVSKNFYKGLFEKSNADVIALRKIKDSRTNELLMLKRKGVKARDLPSDGTLENTLQPSVDQTQSQELEVALSELANVKAALAAKTRELDDLRGVCAQS